MIQIRGLSRSYQAGRGAHRHDVLRNIDIDIPDGAMVALVGRSGSGKTTLLSILGGLDDGFTGSVRVGGLELAGLGDRELSRFRGATVGMVFQADHHVAHLSCLDNVCLPALFTDGAAHAEPPMRQATAPEPEPEQRTRPARRSWSAVRARARQLLEVVGLGELAARRPSELSGGQRQRLGIARALLNRPALLLCDEITGNLDPVTGAEVIELLAELNRRHRVTVMMATHDTQVAQAAEMLLVIEAGRLRIEAGGAGG